MSDWVFGGICGLLGVAGLNIGQALAPTRSLVVDSALGLTAGALTAFFIWKIFGRKPQDGGRR